MKRKQRISRVGTGLFTLISIFYVLPIVVVLFNSFKKKAYINLEPFQLPDETTFTGLENYTTAIDQYGFLKAVGWTVFITVGSVLVILICTSMCAWFITRVRNRFTKAIYILCVFSMVVPFQMVMFTLSLVTDRLGLGTPWGLIIIYLGFGAGLAVFMFCGFVKAIPIEIEEAAMIDGCSPIRTFFSVV
uniref:carbohydrate ABC transporter permease n=1 Tax=uncultured Flavonifractor sp. TaxID=1193534 RepID=UPI00261D7940